MGGVAGGGGCGSGRPRAERDGEVGDVAMGAQAGVNRRVAPVDATRANVGPRAGDDETHLPALLRERQQPRELI
jgi:hypothetical protein